MDVEYKKIKRIQKLDQKHNVYCLKTNNGNFIANGVVVQNCDALRYALLTHKVSSYDPEEYYRKQEEQLRQRMHPHGFGYTNFM